MFLVINMPPFMHGFDPVMLIIESVYTLLVVLLCLLIYFKTKESYDLTKHKGIMYFRDAFLFFGLSYLMRLIFSLTRFYLFEQRGTGGNPIFPVFLLLMGYFSTIAIFYLFFSSLWKKLGKTHFVIIAHIIALILSVISFITRSQDIFAYLQTALLVIITAIVFLSRQVKKISQIKILYGLILLFWLVNIWILMPRWALGIYSFEIKVVLQTISIVIFGLLYYKVAKWLK